MKASTIVCIITGIFATEAIAAPAEAPAGATEVVDITLSGLAKRGGFTSTCWDFAINGNYFYATCSSGGAGSPAIRSAVDINSKITNRSGNLVFDC